MGIAATTAVFSIVDAVLFRPLPGTNPERLVRVFSRVGDSGELSSSSLPVYEDYRDGARSFQALAAYSNFVPIHLGLTHGEPERVNAAVVTGNFFTTLGVRALRGRTLSAADDVAPGREAVLVISDGLWRSRFGAAPDISGKGVRVNGHPFTIVGVMPKDFFGASLEGLPEAWIPMSMAEQASPNWADSLRRRELSWLDMVGRLRPGSTPAGTQAELDAIARRRAAAQPSDRRDPPARVLPASAALLDPADAPRVSRLSWLLLAASGLLLAIACADAAGLAIARAERRRREYAIRLAMGATRSDVAATQLLESLMISLAGAVAGVFLGSEILRWLADARLSDFPIPLGAAARISDSRVVLFAAAVATVAGLAAGLIPSWRAATGEVLEGLKIGAPRRVGKRQDLAPLFSVAQIALAALLLVGAGLLARTLAREAAVDPGFSREGAVLGTVDLSRQRYSRPMQSAFVGRLLARVRALPGVRAAGLAASVPVQSSGMRVTYALEKRPSRGRSGPQVDLNVVTPGFFAALGTPIVRGRDFLDSDRAESSPVVLVNETMARSLWPGRDAVGRSLYDLGFSGTSAEVIGVVRDVRSKSLRGNPEATVFVPWAQSPFPRVTLLVRGEPGSEKRLADGIRAAVRELDPDLPLFATETLEEHVGRTLALARVLASTVGIFALSAVLLASLGLFGMLSQAAQARRREFGVRMALGARPDDVLSLVLRQSLGSAAVGLAAGLAAAMALAPLASVLLYGIRPRDPLVFAAAAGLIVAAALAAALPPAWRAARVDPVETLRAD